MSRTERRLRRALIGGVDNAVGPVSAGSASAAMANKVTDTSLGRGMNNPTFKATFDIVITPYFFTLNGGTYTGITYASLNAGLQTNLPFYMFGTSDFQAGYAKLRNRFPNTNSNWTTGYIGIYGKDKGFSFDGDATVEASLTNGDLVFEMTSTLPGGGTTTLGLVVIHCNNVAYGSLLDAINSDQFIINKIRYKVPSGQEDQFDIEIIPFKQSLFGKSGDDSLSAISFVSPMQQQSNIADLPIGQVINKETSFISYLLAGNTSITWSIFVGVINKGQ